MEKEETKEKKRKGEKETDYVKWLFELSKKDLAIAGGKGASLAEMFNKKFPVPPAFVVTAQAFAEFVAGAKDKIEKILEKTDVDDTRQLNENSRKIREIIEKQPMPKDMEKEILEAYETLGAQKGRGGDALEVLKNAKPIFVAVRSSATTEDLATASFAGQQETFLNVKENKQLITSIRKCFSSLYTPRAIYYREKRGFQHAKALLAVVVQKMINSEKSGVMFTKNPIQENDNVLIEAVFGLGEGLVSGKIKPDNYIVNRKLEILQKKIADKKKALVRSDSGSSEETKLTEEKSKQQVLTDGEIEKLADFGLQIEKYYKKPQDIEFAIENRQVYIVQSRPITTSAKKTGKVQGKILLQGLAASPGVASGKVKIVKTMQDLDKIQKGDILVTEMTNPDMVVTMQKSDAIVTDEGGATSHAAIVSREMGVPCVVGTKSATQLLQEGQIVTVDGASGKVYEGEVGQEKKKEILPIVETKTKIKVILDLPDFAERASKTECKDVGLLRLEGIIASSGKHPLMFLAENRSEDYSKILEKGIEKIAEHFGSIWVRASDIRSDEFRNLQGSPKEQETNPMLGFHGIRFSLKNPQILDSELLAIKNVAEKFPKKQFGIMFPQVISIEETREAKKAFEKFKKENMKFGIMVETPAACQIIEELCNEGLDFISFGTNDLTQYTLAIDRGDENVQDLYNEMHPAVLWQIEQVIKICREKNVETSICGQAASKKEMVEFLIKKNIDSLSVNADAAHDISRFVQHLEQKPYEQQPAEQTTAPTEAQSAEESISKETTDTDKQKPAEEKQEEFPDTNLGIDVFNPEIKMAGAQIEQPKEKETIIGSVITKPEKQREDFPELGIEFDFFKPMQTTEPILSPAPAPFPGPMPGPMPNPVPELIHPSPEPEEEPEEKDENVLDIF